MHAVGKNYTSRNGIEKPGIKWSVHFLSSSYTNSCIPFYRCEMAYTVKNSENRMLGRGIISRTIMPKPAIHRSGCATHHRAAVSLYIKQSGKFITHHAPFNATWQQGDAHCRPNLFTVLYDCYHTVHSFQATGKRQSYLYKSVQKRGSVSVGHEPPHFQSKPAFALHA